MKATYSYFKVFTQDDMHHKAYQHFKPTLLGIEKTPSRQLHKVNNRNTRTR